jgi:hypothetical protein
MASTTSMESSSASSPHTYTGRCGSVACEQWRCSRWAHARTRSSGLRRCAARFGGCPRTLALRGVGRTVMLEPQDSCGIVLMKNSAAMKGDMGDQA